MFNIFKKKTPSNILEKYGYKVDLKSNATPQEIFEITSLPQAYYYCITYTDSYYLLSEVYEKLNDNLKRHFKKEQV